MARVRVVGPRRSNTRPQVACFPSGTRLFNSDHPARRVYLLRSGRVRLSINNEAIIDHLRPGQFFGEKSFLGEHSSQEMAVTLSPVKVVVFRKSEFLRHLQNDPRFANRVLRSLALRLDGCEQTIRDLVTQSTERRLARLLLRVAASGSHSCWSRLPINLTNPEIAKMIGTTRWRVSSLLSSFQRLGCVRREQGLWVNRETLQEYLEPAHPRPA